MHTGSSSRRIGSGKRPDQVRRMIPVAMVLLVLPVLQLVLPGGVVGAAQVDVTGTWNFVVELDIGGGEPVFVFEQQGEMLTGTYQGTFGTADVTGTVTGNEIEFRFGSEGAEAVYTGTIDGDAMRGTCDYGGVGEGSWEATRQP